MKPRNFWSKAFDALLAAFTAVLLIVFLVVVIGCRYFPWRH